MTIQELARLGQDMRAGQNRYFKEGRTQADLQLSKALERAFDEAVAEVLSPPAPTLFDAIDRERDHA